MKKWLLDHKIAFNVKLALTTCFILVFSFGFLITPLFCQEDETKTMTIRYAAREALKVAIEQLSSKDQNEFIPAISTRILENAAEHKQRDKSKTLVEGYIRESLAQAFETDMVKIHKSLNPAEAPDQWFSLDWLHNEYRQHFAQKGEQVITGYAGTHVDPVFTEARRQASETQLKDLTNGAYPSPEEAEALQASNWDTNTVTVQKQQIGSTMHPMTREKLLVEVEQEMDKLADKVLDDVKRQIALQMGAIKEPVPPELVASGRIATKIEENVQQAIAVFKSKAQPYQTVYGIFPCVSRALQSEAGAIETQRFADFCQKSRYTVSTESIKSTIGVHLSDHRKYEESLKRCSMDYYDPFAQSLITQYAAQVQEAEKSNFSKRLLELTTTDGIVREAIKESLGKSIKTPHREARQSISKEQLARFFPGLVDSTWKPDESTLKRIVTNTLTITSFDHCLKLPFLADKTLKGVETQLLDDTENLVLSLTMKCISEGERAWQGQENCVKTYDDRIRGEMYRDVRARSQAEWITYYTDLVTKDWKENRIRIIWGATGSAPSYAAVKYDALFGEMIEQIKANVARNMPEANRRDEERRRPTPAPTAVPTPKSTEVIHVVENNIVEAQTDITQDEPTNAQPTVSDITHSSESTADENVNADSATQQGSGLSYTSENNGPGVGGGSVDTANSKGGGEAEGGTGTGGGYGGASGGKGASGKAEGNGGYRTIFSLSLLLLLLLLLIIMYRLANNYLNSRSTMNVTIPVSNLRESQVLFEALFHLQPSSQDANQVVYKGGASYPQSFTLLLNKGAKP